MRHVDGMGSRFFNIQNGVVGANAGTVPVLPAAAEIVEADRTIQLRAARMQRAAVAPGAYPAFKRGYDLDAVLVPVRQGGEGLLTPIEIPELDHLEIHLAAGQAWTAGLRVGDELRAGGHAAVISGAGPSVLVLATSDRVERVVADLSWRRLLPGIPAYGATVTRL